MSEAAVQCKMRFSSTEAAIQTQVELLSRGFVFDGINQQPRPCYGLVIRRNLIQTIISAGTWRAMYAKEVFEVPELITPTTPNKPRKTLQERAAIGRAASMSYKDKVERETRRLQGVVAQALVNIKDYERNLFGINSRSQARKVAWQKFIQECVRVNGAQPAENTLRNAIRRVLNARGDAFMIPDQRFNRGWMKEVL